MLTGVYPVSGGLYGWQCVCGVQSAAAVPDRHAARDAYKLHRKEHTSMETSTETAEAPAAAGVATEAKGKGSKKKAAPKAPKAKKEKTGKKIWRIGIVTNPKTEREVYPNVSKEGKVFPYQAKKLGVAKVPTWVRVEAKTRAEAIKLVKGGKGDKFTQSKPEPTKKNDD